MDASWAGLIQSLAAKAKAQKKRKKEEKKAKKKEKKERKKRAKAPQSATAPIDSDSGSGCSSDESLPPASKPVEREPIAFTDGLIDTEEAAKRQQRFGSSSHYGIGKSKAAQPKALQAAAASQVTEIFETYDGNFLVGTKLTLEKSYFRITGPVDPRDVRPPHILEAAFARIVRLRVDDDANDDVTYDYLCDQLKGIRQDLTLQGIRTSFTISVYEYHGRIALEEGDLNEYNQCQTQLISLYDTISSSPHCSEFAAYRLLYLLHQGFRGELCAAMAAVDGVRASGGQSSDPAVAHALQVITAVNKDNYHAFFNLYPVTPNNGVYLMDFFLHDMRKRRYQRLLTAYAPTLPLEMMLAALGVTESQFGRIGNEYGTVFTQTPAATGSMMIDTKQSLAHFSRIVAASSAARVAAED